MSDVKIIWRGDEVLAQVIAAVNAGMETAGKAMVASTKRSISTPHPPASRPGQPPHRRSGGLTGAITAKLYPGSKTSTTLQVGVPRNSPIARQAAALQKGTSRMAARPFLPEVERAKATVIGYIEGAIRASVGN